MIMPWLHKDTPWYAQMALVVTFWLGPAALVAAVFLSMWTGWIPSPITDNGRKIDQLSAKFDQAIMKMTERVGKAGEADDSQTRILLVICRNTSKTPLQQAQCDDYWKR